MRIIYEDGNYREEREKAEQAQTEREFTDISSMSEEFKKNIEQENAPGKPYKPVASLRTEQAAPAEKSSASVPAEHKVQTDATAFVQTPPPVQNPAVNLNAVPFMPAYAAQPPYYGYPQGYPVQYPQGYAYPPQYQAMPRQMPVQPQQMPQAPGQSNPAGTRVIFQSPDFDKKESHDERPAQQAVASPFMSISQEDVSLTAAYKNQPIIKALPDKGFEVDDMEMSIFELNAMAHKYQAKAKAYKNPHDKSGSFEIEDCEEAVPQPKPEFNLFEDEDEPEKKISKNTAKKKKKKRKEIIRRTVLAISIIAIVVSAGLLVNEYRLSDMNAQLNEKTNDLVIDVDNIYDEYVQEHYEELTEPDGTVHELTEEEKQEIQKKEWEKIKKKYPNIDFPEGMQLEYAKLYAENQDFVGFLKADGIDLSLPVVQTSNDEYYLKKDFYKRNTKYGTPFVTHLNTISTEKYGLDTNTIIFGHHMNDGSVFGILDEYKTIEGFKKAPVITFDTMYHDYQWKVIAAFVTNAEPSDDNGYVFKYYFTGLSSEERFNAYKNALDQRSLYYTGVDWLPTDKILTLSTCSHEFENARFVVVARMVRNGEVPEVDVSRATVNSNPRYPQAYYDKKKKDNPYKDAYRWEVG